MQSANIKMTVQSLKLIKLKVILHFDFCNLNYYYIIHYLK